MYYEKNNIKIPLKNVQGDQAQAPTERSAGGGAFSCQCS